MLLFVDLLYLHKQAFEAAKSERAAVSKRLRPAVREVLRRKYNSGDCTTATCIRGPTTKSSIVWEWCMKLSTSDAADTGEKGPDWVKKATAAVVESWEKGDQSVHLDKLREVWGELKTDMFAWLLPKLGQVRKKKLLDGLCVNVPSRLLGQRKYQYRDTFCNVKLARCPSWDGRPQPDAGSDAMANLKGLADLDPPTPGPQDYRYESHKSRVDVYYTEVQRVLVDPKIEGEGGRRDLAPLDLIRWIESLNACCDDGDLMFETPFGQALSESSWDIAYATFMGDCLMMLLFQYLLSWYLAPVSHKLVGDEHETTSLSFLAVCIIICVGLRGSVMLIMEMCVLRGNNLAVGIFNPDTWVKISIEGYSLYFVCALGHAYILNGDVGMLQAINGTPITVVRESFLSTHPFQLSALIFLKWLLLMLKLMNVGYIVDCLYPAYKAIVSKDSIAFLGYLGLLSVGTGLAYYSLPIPDLVSAGGSWGIPYMMAFMRASRLDFLGDIEFAELAGEDEQPDRRLGRPRGNSGSGESDISDIINSYRWSLQLFTLVCSLLFPVILLNLYVGLLSSAYQKARDHLLHNKSLLHATTASKALLRRRLAFHSDCLSWMMYRMFSRAFGSVWRNDPEGSPSNPKDRGTWIVLPRHTNFDMEGPGDWDTVEDEEENDDGLEHLEHHIRHLGDKISTHLARETTRVAQ